MADAVKHPPGGSLAANLRWLLPVLHTQKIKVFAYGFGVTFVAYTIFIAFNPASGSAFPWYNCLFTSVAPIRSPFNSLFSYIFPNSSLTHGHLRGVGVLPSGSNSSSSSGAATGTGGVRAPPSSTNRAQQDTTSLRNQTSGGLEANQKGVPENSWTKKGGASRQDSSPSTNQSGEGAAPEQKGTEVKNPARGDGWQIDHQGRGGYGGVGGDQEKVAAAAIHGENISGGSLPTGLQSPTASSPAGFLTG